MDARPFLEVYDRGGPIASALLALALACGCGVAILLFLRARGRRIHLFWLLVLPAVPWIVSGPAALALLGLLFGSMPTDDLERRAMFLARVIGDVESIRSIGAISTGLLAFVAAFVLAVASQRVRAPYRRRLASLIGVVALVPAIALTISTVIGAPRIYFAFGVLLILGAIALGIAAAACGADEQRESGSLAVKATLALSLAFAALVIAQLLQVEARALAGLPAASPDARPQLVLAMLQEMESVTALFRVLPLLSLPITAIAWWASRRSSLRFTAAYLGASVVLTAVALDFTISELVESAKAVPIDLELVQLPKRGPASIELVLTDPGPPPEWRPQDNLRVALTARVSSETLHAFIERVAAAGVESMVLVGDASGWVERISIEEIAARDPSAVVFARSYGTVSVRISSEPLPDAIVAGDGPQTIHHVVLGDHASAQALADAVTAFSGGETVLHARSR